MEIPEQLNCIVTVTVESGLHISNEKVTSSFNTNDLVVDVLNQYLHRIKAPGIGQIRYVLKDENGITLKNGHSLRRALNIERNCRFRRCTEYKVFLTVIHDGQSLFSYANVWSLVIICSLFTLLTMGLSLGLYLRNRAAPTMYGVIFDAGSVHTTMNVYKWSSDKYNGTGIVEEIYFCETSAKIGISSFKDNPKAVRDYIKNSNCTHESLKQIESFNPNESNDQIVVFLGATAGMRILNTSNPRESSQIMSNLTVTLKNIYKTKKVETKILSGIDEGIYGWITVNYLSKVFGKVVLNNHTIGALDWGGASSQITFQTDNNYTDHRAHTYLYGNNYTLFVRSHLCFGQSEATRRYLVSLILKNYKSTGQLSYKVDSPCHHRLKDQQIKPYSQTAENLFYSPCTTVVDDGFKQEISNLSLSQKFNFIGTSNYSQCIEFVDQSFDPKICGDTFGSNHCFNATQIPKPDSEGHYLAFSTYYYLLKALHLRTDVTVKEFRETVKSVCLSDYESLKVAALGEEAKRNSCLNSRFMYKLLTGGYHFKNWTNIDFVERVDDAEVGWTLGYTIQKTNEFPSIGANVQLTLVVFILLLICAVSFATLGIFFAYHAHHISRPSTQYQRFEQIIN